jgi:hypothetical protein
VLDEGNWAQEIFGEAIGAKTKGHVGTCLLVTAKLFRGASGGIYDDASNRLGSSVEGLVSCGTLIWREYAPKKTRHQESGRNWEEEAVRLDRANVRVRVGHEDQRVSVARCGICQRDMPI